jgi:hypothetical protein
VERQEEKSVCADIHSTECSWWLANILACSQKASHREVRLVSAAVGTSYPFVPFALLG